MSELLTNISDGEAVEVLEVSSSEFRVKLLEMGILEGQTLTVLFRAPLGGPIAVNVNGYVLSLRLDEARLVKVARLYPKENVNQVATKPEKE